MKKYEIEINGEFYEVTVRELEDNAEIPTGKNDEKSAQTDQINTPAPAHADDGAATINAPMSGTILKIYASPGQEVRQGDTLLVLEAMKMENEVVSPIDGVVQEVHVQENERVASDQLLVTL